MRKLKCIEDWNYFEVGSSNGLFFEGEVYIISETNGGGWVVNANGDQTYMHLSEEEIKTYFRSIQEDREYKLDAILK